MFFTAAGSTFEIGQARPNWEARQVTTADFTAETWVPVEEINSLGRISGEWQTDEYSSPNSDDPENPTIPTVQKIGRPAQSMQVVAAMVADDAGQIALLEAEAVTYPFAFRLTTPDGSRRLFVALVLAADHVFDEARSVVSWAFSLRLQSNILRGGP